MKETYEVYLSEVFIHSFRIDADTPKEAIELAKKSQGRSYGSIFSRLLDDDSQHSANLVDPAPLTALHKSDIME